MSESVEPYIGMNQCPFCLATEGVTIGTDDEAPTPNWGMRCSGCGAHSPAFDSLGRVRDWMKEPKSMSWQEYKDMGTSP